MKKIALSMIVAFAIYVTAAAAQSGGMGGAQGTQGSSPSAQQPGQTQPGAQPGMPGPDVAPNDQTNTTANTGNTNKGEKKLKGCVQSQGGQYALEMKHGKTVNLAGQDLSAHVGHEVAVKGTYESGNATGMSSTSTGNSNAGEKTFNVTSVEMVSDTCKMGSKNGSSSNGMGAGSTGSSSETPSHSSGSGTTGGNNSTGGTTGNPPPQQ